MTEVSSFFFRVSLYWDLNNQRKIKVSMQQKSRPSAHLMLLFSQQIAFSSKTKLIVNLISTSSLRKWENPKVSTAAEGRSGNWPRFVYQDATSSASAWASDSCVLLWKLCVSAPNEGLQSFCVNLLSLPWMKTTALLPVTAPPITRWRRLYVRKQRLYAAFVCV